MGNDPPFKDAVVLLDAPFKLNVELMRTIRDAADGFPSPRRCYWAGYQCPDCGAHVPACACGDWGCNLSSHTALVCPAFRDDDLIADVAHLCECGHPADRHRNDRSCCYDVRMGGCPCTFFVAREP